MRRGFLLPVILLAAILNAAAQADVLRVMSFNVRYPAQGDGPDVWEQRRDLLVATVREAHPDVLGTQELFYAQGEYLVEKLPEYAWFGLSRYGNHENEHMGVFYRKDKFKLLESGNFWLSETPEKPGSMSWGVNLPRLVTWGQFERVADSFRFYFYNTHFPHRAQDAPARENCSRLLVDRIRQLPSQIPVILTGDFNTDAGSPPYELVAEHLQDAWRTAEKREGPEGTFHGFRGTPGSVRIDWILYRGSLKVSQTSTVTRNENGRYPSDHFPVTAVLLPAGIK